MSSLLADVNSDSAKYIPHTNYQVATPSVTVNIFGIYERTNMTATLQMMQDTSVVVKCASNLKQGPKGKNCV